MKNKVLLCLLLIIMLFTVTGCGPKRNVPDNREENKNEAGATPSSGQTGYVEGEYFIDDLTFSLYEGFNKIGENMYSLANDENGISISFYHDTDIHSDIYDYIKSDPHDFLPNTANITDKSINGNVWKAGVTDDRVYIYYIKRGNDVYSISIMPLFTTSGTLKEVISTLENSLYFKQ